MTKATKMARTMTTEAAMILAAISSCRREEGLHEVTIGSFLGVMVSMALRWTGLASTRVKWRAAKSHGGLFLCLNTPKYSNNHVFFSLPSLATVKCLVFHIFGLV